MPENDSLTRLQELFRELFQLDLADLDFGLYRIFKIKQQEVEQFLTTQLPAEVNAAFSEVTEADKEKLAKQVEELASRVRLNIADDAILPSGDANPAYEKMRIVGEYRDARDRLARVEAGEAHRAEVFNHLYAFFSRYYDDGDFIPRRFFGSGAAYAVPYNGEEVYFHWANKDQYYVKSGEQFRDYAFVVATAFGEYRVRFRIVQATTAKDNVKGEARHFIPLPDQVTCDEATRTLVIPFEYRVLTEEEKRTYRRNSKTREKILDEYEPRLLEAVNDEALHAALVRPQPTGREAEGETPPTLLRKRLAHFTKKRTSDFFVHKNLGAFLRQELDFFLRDQVITAFDLEGDVDARRRMLRVLRKVADTVITFLASIEDAQKRLFEKKKFVLRSDWLAPIGNVPRDLWPEVLANEAQLAEWRTLYALEPQSDLFQTEGLIDEHTLEMHPTLVVDTRHFPTDFARRLLESVPDIDEWTDGVLFHSENFQALSLMQERYREQIKCIHIDPPYNTATSGFLYKNAYEHSTWMAMLSERVLTGRHLLRLDGLLACHIDEYELGNVGPLLSSALPIDVGVLVWDKGMPTTGQVGLAIQHEYILIRAQTPVRLRIPKRNLDTIAARIAELREKYGGPTKEALNEYRAWLRGARFLSAAERTYDQFDDEGRAFRSDNMSATEKRTDARFFVPLVHPVTGKPCPVPQYGWRYTPESLAALMANGDVLFGADEWVVPRKKTYLDVTTSNQMPSVLRVGSRGKQVLDRMGLEFAYSHPVELYSPLLSAAGDADAEVLDYFAGSGTTGHAVINLNREDGGRRKFILVEMAEYFDTVLVPRIKKVMFTPEWKDGKPKRMATAEEAERTPRLVQVLRLESYEDALHNTFSEANLAKGEARAEAVKTHAGADAYRVRYMLRLPLDTSDSMISPSKLEHPWDCAIEVLTDYGPETRTVDVVETFHWLYGLRLRTTGMWINADDTTEREPQGRQYCYYTATDRQENKRILVVWRDMTQFDAVKDRQFLEAHGAELGDFDEKLVNGDTCAEGFSSLDPLFMRLMDPVG